MVLASAAAALASALCLARAARPAARSFATSATRRRRSARVKGWCVAVGAIVLGVVSGPTTIVVIAVGLVAARVTRRRGRDRRRRAAIDDGLPDAIELMVVIVKAGLSPLDAVRATRDVIVPPVRGGFDEVVLRLERGQRLADALGALPEVLGPGALALADGIAAADRYGTPLTPVLDRLAVEARDARRRASEARARTLPVRLSFPLVCCTLPSFVLMAIVPALLGALSSLRGTAP